MPNLKSPVRQDIYQALRAVDAQEQRQEEAIIVWIDDEPPTLWRTFEKHALLIVGGALLGAALLYLAALVRGI